MVDFVLQHDSVEPICLDGDFSSPESLIGLDGHLIVPIDVAFMLIVHGEATLTGFEIAFLYGIGDDFGIDELIGREKASLEVVAVVDDEHSLVDADLGRGQSHSLANRWVFGPISFVLGQLEIFEHLIERLFVLAAQRERNVLGRETKGWVFVFDDFYHR